jgi:hypothetical protein
MVNGIGPMPDDDRITRYHETAEALREIAGQLRFDPRRASQIRALADGFERFATSLEHEMADAANWQQGVTVLALNAATWGWRSHAKWKQSGETAILNAPLDACGLQPLVMVDIGGGVIGGACGGAVVDPLLRQAYGAIFIVAAHGCSCGVARSTLANTGRASGAVSARHSATKPVTFGSFRPFKRTLQQFAAGPQFVQASDSVKARSLIVTQNSSQSRTA